MNHLLFIRFSISHLRNLFWKNNTFLESYMMEDAFQVLVSLYQRLAVTPQQGMLLTGFSSLSIMQTNAAKTYGIFFKACSISPSSILYPFYLYLIIHSSSKKFKIPFFPKSSSISRFVPSNHILHKFLISKLLITTISFCYSCTSYP